MEADYLLSMRAIADAKGEPMLYWRSWSILYMSGTGPRFLIEAKKKTFARRLAPALGVSNIDDLRQLVTATRRYLMELFQRGHWSVPSGVDPGLSALNEGIPGALIASTPPARPWPGPPPPPECRHRAGPGGRAIVARPLRAPVGLVQLGRPARRPGRSEGRHPAGHPRGDCDRRRRRRRAGRHAGPPARR